MSCMSWTPWRSMERPLDAEPEREAGVDVGVDAARAQHLAVDHAGAPELDPARAAARAARLGAPQVSSPWQAKQRKSVSTLGSVNGK